MKLPYLIASILLISLTGCSSTSSTTSPATSSKPAPPVDREITLNTTPQGATCFLTGFEAATVVTPGPLLLPAVSRKTGFIVCNKEGFFESRSDLHKFIEDKRHTGSIVFTIPLNVEEAGLVKATFSSTL